MKKDRPHYNLQEKRNLIKNHVYNLQEAEALKLATFVDGFTFQMLDQMAKVFKVMSQGKIERRPRQGADPYALPEGDPMATER